MDHDNCFVAVRTNVEIRARMVGGGASQRVNRKSVVVHCLRSVNPAHQLASLPTAAGARTPAACMQCSISGNLSDSDMHTCRENVSMMRRRVMHVVRGVALPFLD